LLCVAAAKANAFLSDSPSTGTKRGAGSLLGFQNRVSVTGRNSFQVMASVPTVILTVDRMRRSTICGCACGETVLLTWLLGVSGGDTWLLLPDLVEVCAKGCFRIVFDSVGSAGVVLGPTLVVGHGVYSISLLYSTLWDWLALLSLVREAHPPTLFRWLAIQQGPSVSCRRVFAAAAWLREHACGVAFTGAGLLPVDLVEGSCLIGCPLVVGSASLLELSRCFVCRVAPLVERCDTCLWLLSALCWLVVNSGEVLPEFFYVGSGG
ncbi:hypothetical protein Taro_052265, partial [Colocasia esculenta]|nr:hypothetical protein [Colocasia esculenta]